MSTEPTQNRSPRRRHRRGKRRPGEDTQAQPKNGKGPAALPPARPILPPRSIFDAHKPANAELSEDERGELKQHFAFMARFRDALRLKVNAAEDLLINGARPPEDRGVCQHLLGKVDRATVNAALTRLKEPEQRTRFLGGVVRFTRDVAIVILYLESLSASAPRAEAAATLVAALRQIDFAGVSPAQLRRLLDLVVTLLLPEDRPHFVLSLLRSSTFRAAFDHTADILPKELADLFVPMRAVFGLAFLEEPEDGDADAVARGVRILLSASTAHLMTLPEAARGRLLRVAVDLPHDQGQMDAAIAALLRSLPKVGRSYSQIATKRARQHLRAGEDARAEQILRELKDHQPEYKIPGRWLAALAAPRLGRVALIEDAITVPPSPGAHRGFWLDRQRPVWLFAGTPDDRDAFAAAAEVHRALALPGLAPILTTGLGAEHVPYWTVPLFGEPAKRGVRELRREPLLAIECARSGVEVLHALALSGVVLPDAGSERFLIDPHGRLLLASLVACRRESVETALVLHLDVARTLTSDVLEAALGHRAPRDLLDALATASTLVAMVRHLADADPAHT